jgi:hypothetical protein
MSGSHVRRVLEKHNIRTPAHGSLARHVRYVFSATKYSHILSRHGGNDVCEKKMEKKGTDGSTVGRGCWSWRRTAGKPLQGIELASCRQPYEFMSPPRGRLKPTHDGGRSQPEERHGLAAAVLKIIRRRKNPLRGFFRKYSRIHDLLWRGDSIHVSDH